MNRESLLALYERLTGLVEKLPGGLQKPILRELVPIRQLFLEQRPGRIVLLGHPEPETQAFLNRILVAHQSVKKPENFPPLLSDHGKNEEKPTNTKPETDWGSRIESGESDNGWRSFHVPGRGSVQVLDCRQADFPTDLYELALKTHAPDLIILFQEGTDTAGLAFAMEKAAQATEVVVRAGAPAPALIGLASNKNDTSSVVENLRTQLHGSREFATQNIRVLPLADAFETGHAICAFLPYQARLEFALLGQIRQAQADIARSLLKSFTAVCGVIGMQPIPLADLPVLTTLQSLMVGLIAYTSGRQLGPRAVTEFFGAVGVSVGMGMVFREGARALIKVVPGFGNALSGLVAGAGTYAIGRAAIAYFIEELPMVEARKLFHTIRPKRGTFRSAKLKK